MFFHHHMHLVVCCFVTHVCTGKYPAKQPRRPGEKRMSTWEVMLGRGWSCGRVLNKPNKACGEAGERDNDDDVGYDAADVLVLLLFSFSFFYFFAWLDGLIIRCDVCHAMFTDSPSTFPLRSVGLFGVGVRGFVSPTPLRSVCVGVLFVVPSRVWNSTGVPQYPARGDFYFVLCGCVWGWGGVGCLVCVVWWSCASVFFPLICAC